jgi:hypothetical protein
LFSCGQDIGNAGEAVNCELAAEQAGSESSLIPLIAAQFEQLRQLRNTISPN